MMEDIQIYRKIEYSKSTRLAIKGSELTSNFITHHGEIPNGYRFSADRIMRCFVGIVTLACFKRLDAPNVRSLLLSVVWV